MITKRTVFILGAGASMPFGFPSGTTLVEEILDKLTKADTRPVVDDTLQKCDYDCGMSVDSFLDALRKSGRDSIDAFLEHNPQYLSIGKIAIGAVLCPREQEDRLFQTKANWYKYLFSHLSSTFDEFPKNQVAFVTFNYDRSLEHFLTTSLRNSYQGHTFEDCARCVGQVPILHVHGRLGVLPTDSTKHDDNQRQYNGRLTSYDLRICEKSIRIIHEEVGDSLEFQEARRLLKEAEQICILGLGYSKTNLDRLGLRKRAFDVIVEKKGAIYGTSFGLGRAEEEWVSSYFCNCIALEKVRIDDFLRDQPVLMQPMDLTEEMF